MTRRLLPILIVALVVVGLLAQSVAFGQTEPSTSTQLALPGSGFVVNVGDLTFPGAVFLGAWMIARALPGALASWKPTLRVELVHGDPKPSNE